MLLNDKEKLLGCRTFPADMSSVDEPNAVPKVEQFEDEDSFDSDQEPDGHNHAPEAAQVQKRKGGRKPVRLPIESHKVRTDFDRSTRHQRSGSKGTGRLRLPFGRDEQNI